MLYARATRITRGFVLTLLASSVAAQAPQAGLDGIAKAMIGLGAAVVFIGLTAAAYYLWQQRKLHNQQHSANGLRSELAGAFDSVVVAKKRQGGPLGIFSTAGDIEMGGEQESSSSRPAKGEEAAPGRLRMVYFDDRLPAEEQRRLRAHSVRDSVTISRHKVSIPPSNGQAAVPSASSTGGSQAGSDSGSGSRPGSGRSSAKDGAVAYYQQQLALLQLGPDAAEAACDHLKLPGEACALSDETSGAVFSPGPSSSSEASKPRVQCGGVAVRELSNADSFHLDHSASGSCSGSGAVPPRSSLRRGDDTARVQGPTVSKGESAQ